jgi:ribosomal protein L11 methyltransferase
LLSFFILFWQKQAMTYIALYVRLKVPLQEKHEMIIAELHEAGFEGFIETESGIVGYIPSERYEMLDPKQIRFLDNPAFAPVTIEKEFILDKNWNELWERSYEPAVIGNEIIVRAPFHQSVGTYNYELLIEPKMSFGTGHHPTTALMCEQLLKSDMVSKDVLDMGCGTGILGILAAMMKAKSVTAIDLNEWACENAKENALKNGIDNIRIHTGSIELTKGKLFDIVLANISKKILTEHIPIYSNILVKDGTLLMSGILIDDLNEICDICQDRNLLFCDYVQKKEWIALRYLKK